MKKKLIAASLAISLGIASFGAALPVEAIGLGGLIKGGIVGVGVDKYGPSINSFLNKLLNQKNLGTTYATKVVPIVSLGNGSRVGAAQVTAEVERVKAVAQVEGSFNNIARAKGLVPVDSANPAGASRIQGVGVSAVIDLKI